MRTQPIKFLDVAFRKPRVFYVGYVLLLCRGVTTKKARGAGVPGVPRHPWHPWLGCQGCHRPCWGAKLGCPTKARGAGVPVAVQAPPKVPWRSHAWCLVG
jgi:hypothetical protein